MQARFAEQLLDYWSGRRDSNSRPPAPHAGTLPGCATPRGGGSIPAKDRPPLYRSRSITLFSSCLMFVRLTLRPSGDREAAPDDAPRAGEELRLSSSLLRAPLMVNPC